MPHITTTVRNLSCGVFAALAAPRPALVGVGRTRMMSSGRVIELLRVFDREEYCRAIPSEWSHLPLTLRWLKPTSFLVATSLGIFGLAAYCTNRDTDVVLRNPSDSDVFSPTGNEELRMLRSSGQRKLWVEAVAGSQGLPINAQIAAAFRHPLLFLQTNVTPEMITVALLLPVSLAWHFPHMRTTLFRHWTHSFRSGKAYTMLTAMFSHQLPFQWANIFAAWATTPIVATWFLHSADSVQHESTPWYHLGAFCLSAGVFSVLGSQCLAYLRFRSAFQQLARGIPGPYTNININKVLSYSMGVSGVIHACLTLSVCANPNAPASSINPEVSRGVLWATICAIEAVCLSLCAGNVGWASNLCGAAFGAIYSVIGPSFWTSARMFVHRIQFPKAWELGRETPDDHPYPGKHRTDPHPLFKRSFGQTMGWND